MVEICALAICRRDFNRNLLLANGRRQDASAYFLDVSSYCRTQLMRCVNGQLVLRQSDFVVVVGEG